MQVIGDTLGHVDSVCRLHVTIIRYLLQDTYRTHTPTRGDEVMLAYYVLGLLRKLGSSGSPGQLQQQQTKMLEKVNINFNFGHMCL